MEVRLVLEGGMLCGLYQVGVLREVRRQEELGAIRVTALSGTSVGAYLAFAYLTDTLERAAAVLVESRDKFKETGSAGHFAKAIHAHALSVGRGTFERRLRTKMLDCSSTAPPRPPAAPPPPPPAAPAARVCGRARDVRTPPQD